jgi:hypothetical protein
VGVDPDQLCHLQCFFLCFEVVSGLKINLAKLELVPVGNVDQFAFKVSWSSIGGSYKPKPIWDDVIQKIER